MQHRPLIVVAAVNVRSSPDQPADLRKSCQHAGGAARASSHLFHVSHHRRIAESREHLVLPALDRHLNRVLLLYPAQVVVFLLQRPVQRLAAQVKVEVGEDVPQELLMLLGGGEGSGVRVVLAERETEREGPGFIGQRKHENREPSLHVGNQTDGNNGNLELTWTKTLFSSCTFGNLGKESINRRSEHEQSRRRVRDVQRLPYQVDVPRHMNADIFLRSEELICLGSFLFKLKLWSKLLNARPPTSTLPYFRIDLSDDLGGFTTFSCFNCPRSSGQKKLRQRLTYRYRQVLGIRIRHLIASKGRQE
eukprot:768178-Hanusia_phi.AAC.3